MARAQAAKPDLKKAFGERVSRERRLKQARDDRDILKQDIAEAIGASESVVGRWLAGEAMPRDDVMMMKLASYFGVTPAWLRYGQEPRTVGAKERVLSEPPNQSGGRKQA